MHQETIITTERRRAKPDELSSRRARPSRLFGGRIQILLSALLLSLPATASHAQTTMQMPHNTTAPATSEAQKIFEKMKTLAGSWLGSMTTTPQVAGGDGKLVEIALRVTSSGNALMHEITLTGVPDDPLTVFYLEGDRLLLTHYCDAGNRPRMEGRISADGKSLEFDFIDLVGGNQKGHMHHAVFTIIDANHHIEDWTYMLPGDRPLRAHFDLQRRK
ncbi:MAG: hypothetical protein M3362_27125 [Acidobacteriota bacterium]|nr:hypothetical protein [Acidobacteriota bacterium]